MFAHVTSPHVPIVFDRAGQMPDLPCDPCGRSATHHVDSGLTSEQFRRAFSDQVHHLNGLVLDVIDELRGASPDAVVVVFSDHGTRSNLPVDDDWFDTFFAARTPGREGVFPDDVRPIEIFPHLLGAYFGDELPIPADRDFHAPQGHLMPLEIVEWER